MKCLANSPPLRRWPRRSVLTLGAAWALGLPACGQREAAVNSSFLLLDGSRVTMAALRGKVVLVNFWATSCATCVAEMPALVETHQRYAAQGYDTIAVAMSYDPPAYVQRFAQSRGLPFKVALDHDGQIAKDWGDVRLTPTSFLVDAQGLIVKRYVGAPDFAALHRLIQDLLPRPVS